MKKPMTATIDSPIVGHGIVDRHENIVQTDMTVKMNEEYDFIQRNEN